MAVYLPHRDAVKVGSARIDDRPRRRCGGDPMVRAGSRAGADLASASDGSVRSGSAADREILRLVAELYYERDLRQPEIADLTGFSVSKISRILALARELGVVRISVEPVA